MFLKERTSLKKLKRREYDELEFGYQKSKYQIYFLKRSCLKCFKAFDKLIEINKFSNKNPIFQTFSINQIILHKFHTFTPKHTQRFTKTHSNIYIYVVSVTDTRLLLHSTVHTTLRSKSVTINRMAARNIQPCAPLV